MTLAKDIKARLIDAEDGGAAEVRERRRTGRGELIEALLQGTEKKAGATVLSGEDLKGEQAKKADGGCCK